MKKSEAGQVSIEYLLLMAGAVMLAVLLGSMLLNIAREQSAGLNIARESTLTALEENFPEGGDEVIVLSEGDNLGNHIAEKDLDMAGHKIVNLEALGGADYEAANKKYVKDAITSRISAVGGDNLGDHTATQKLNMSNYNIFSLAPPTKDDEAANKKYVDDEIGKVKATAAGGDNLGDHTAIKNLNMNNKQINSLAEPTANRDAATKQYVDTKKNEAMAEAKAYTDSKLAAGGNFVWIGGSGGYIKDGAHAKIEYTHLVPVTEASNLLHTFTIEAKYEGGKIMMKIVYTTQGSGFGANTSCTIDWEETDYIAANPGNCIPAGPFYVTPIGLYFEYKDMGGGIFTKTDITRFARWE